MAEVVSPMKRQIIGLISKREQRNKEKTNAWEGEVRIYGVHILERMRLSASAV